MEVIMILFILFIAFGVRLYKIDTPLADWHSWRQVDTASVSRIYLDEGVELLRPRYYDISSIQTGYSNPEGLRFVEFPIFNLIHLSFVQLLPNVSFTALGRLVSVTAAVFTTFFVYKLGKSIFDKWSGLAAAFFYAIIPFNVFFTRVILPDPLAVAFTISGLWFFWVYYKNDKIVPLFLSGILFSLAMLTKPHSLFLAIPVAFFVLKKFSVKKIFQNIPLLLTLSIALIPFLLWRAWIDRGTNFVGIPHISWAFNGDGIRFRPAFWRWIFGYRLGELILGMWGLVLFCFGLLSLKKKHLYIVLLLVGAFTYVTVVATANVRHDYYQTFVMPAIVLALGYGAASLWHAKDFNVYLRRGLVIFSTGMMLLIGWDQVKGFYNINHNEIIVAGEAANRLLPKDAQVIAPYNGDTAFLYQTRRFGWPMVLTSIDDHIEQGADYYISVNNDADTAKYKQRFEVVEETDSYIILDLRKEI